MAIKFVTKTEIKAQSKTYIESLIFDKAFIAILIEYSNYNNIF